MVISNYSDTAAQEIVLGPKNHEIRATGSFSLDTVSEGVCMHLPF